METNIKYKTIFLDIDGTLLRRNHTISKVTREVLTKLKECNVNCIICSGRPRETTLEFSKQINGSRYIISATGGDVYDAETDTEIYRDLLKKRNS